jgi:hypothetical protein
MLMLALDLHGVIDNVARMRHPLPTHGVLVTRAGAERIGQPAMPATQPGAIRNRVQQVGFLGVAHIADGDGHHNQVVGLQVISVIQHGHIARDIHDVASISEPRCEALARLAWFVELHPTLQEQRTFAGAHACGPATFITSR